MRRGVDPPVYLYTPNPNPSSRKRVYHVYDTLQWEDELGFRISESHLKESLEHIHLCSNNTRHCLIHFKIIHHLHFSRERLHNIYPDISPTCIKCCSANDSLPHSFALCPKVQKYWSRIFNVIPQILHTHSEPNLFIITLGISDDLKKLNNMQRCFLSYGLISAKNCFSHIG